MDEVGRAAVSWASEPPYMDEQTGWLERGWVETYRRWDPFREQWIQLLRGPGLPPCPPGCAPWSFGSAEELEGWWADGSPFPYQRTPSSAPAASGRPSTGG